MKKLIWLTVLDRDVMSLEGRRALELWPKHQLDALKSRSRVGERKPPNVAVAEGVLLQTKFSPRGPE